MATHLQLVDPLPDMELPDQRSEVTRLSQFTRPGLLDQHLGFLYGYPLIPVFDRGFFWPREQSLMRELHEVPGELAVNYGRLILADAMRVPSMIRPTENPMWYIS